MPTLYIVATPIGNLEDITLRALRILKEVDLILCEDTRVTGKLLKKYDITTPRESYHAHSKLSKTEKIFELLKEGKSIALVSDAGTPTISDPGVKLVAEVRAAFRRNRSDLKEPERRGRSDPGGEAVNVVPIPGPSALTAALSASGISSAEFTFLGFLPHKKGRETLFKEIAESKRTVVFYESPHRILKALDSLDKNLSPAGGGLTSRSPKGGRRSDLKEQATTAEEQAPRKVILARELTKIHEEFLSGTPEELLTTLTENPQKQKGEFVVIVSGT